MVRKKQIRISRAFMIRKIKFANVSNPSRLERISSGSGKMVIRKNAMGNSSQAMEFLIDIRFLMRQEKISINSTSAAMEISICRELIAYSS